MENSENKFSNAEKQVLAVLVDMIVPASQEYHLPGAGDETIFTDILNTMEPHHPVLSQGLFALESLALKIQSCRFLDLSQDQKESIIEIFRRDYETEAGLLATVTVQCYYRDDRVMRALDMEIRPPFPEGFSVIQGDWSLLDPVRQRQPFYRPIS